MSFATFIAGYVIGSLITAAVGIALAIAALVRDRDTAHGAEDADVIAALVTALGGTRAALFALLALVAVVFANAQTLRLAHLRAEVATHERALADANAAAQSAARETERKLVDAAVDASGQYEKGKADANTAADALLVDLLNRNIGLRARWQCPSVAVVPATAGTARELNAADADRAASASRIVRAAKDCEAQVTALQAFILAERKVMK